ncbi:phosphoribosylglycinamide formyltransferase [Halteromyces radiatus]|uniref:phosphoribosylglycinamide formyltransferase n=1 Tax=Halteromyces radiatus TaxID=101107 RepID=UPI00221FBA6F|nr:phosphoribosylglycinamide formyltransferase [Halteromyces radiatus]KAI8100096.1 phosphoribosylglycinamide formyltransferase [Halteromyces radiatus]
MASNDELPRIVVLISGSGSNLQALIDATQTPRKLQAKIVGVISNRQKAYGLQRAQQAGIPTETVSLKKFKDQGKTREDFDESVATLIHTMQPDLIVLAGWMHILSPTFLAHFPNNVMNLHPALPGQFDGAHAIERAFEAYQQGRISETGIMVHKVIADVDRGQVILQQPIPILPDDTLETLEDRIHKEEHKIIVQGAQVFLDELACQL